MTPVRDNSIFEGADNNRAWRGAEIKLLVAESEKAMQKQIEITVQPLSDKIDNLEQGQRRLDAGQIEILRVLTELGASVSDLKKAAPVAVASAAVAAKSADAILGTDYVRDFSQLEEIRNFARGTSMEKQVEEVVGHFAVDGVKKIWRSRWLLRVVVFLWSAALTYLVGHTWHRQQQAQPAAIVPLNAPPLQHDQPYQVIPETK